MPAADSCGLRLPLESPAAVVLFHLVVTDNANVEQGFHVVLVQFQNLAVSADTRLYFAEQDMSARLDGKRIYIVGIDGKQRIANGNHLGRIVARIVVFDKLQIDAALEPRLLFLDFQQQIFINVRFSQPERLRLHIFEKVVESNTLLLRQFDELNLLLLVALQPVKSQSKGMVGKSVGCCISISSYMASALSHS